MPCVKQPNSLKFLCAETICRSMDSYWLKENCQLRKTYEQDFAANNVLYVIGPFECLDDETIEHILKSLYQRNMLNKLHLYLCLHNRLRRVDFSYVKKKNLVNGPLMNYVGLNCFNLVELNLFAQVDLTPASLCSLFRFMKNLKLLNLSHTKANMAVVESITRVCTKLESLHLENCQLIYDACVDLIGEKLRDTLKVLNIDNIQLSPSVVKRLLFTCKKLKYLHANELINILASIHFADESSLAETEKSRFELAKMFVDPDIILKQDKMEALEFTCPHLKELSINCIGTTNTLIYLTSFHSLSELVLGNTSSCLSFLFGGSFLSALKDSLGVRLKSLHLIHIVDVNLRSIAKYCPNLVRLHVEFLGYYEPARDDCIEADDHLPIRTLRHLTISNVSSKFEQIHRNIGQFRKDLTMLIGNGSLKHLSLSCLQELDDNYFECLFLTPLHFSSSKYIYESIENIEFREMNTIGYELITQCLLKRVNCLKELSLINCKLISHMDMTKMKYFIFRHNLNCKLNWT